MSSNETTLEDKNGNVIWRKRVSRIGDGQLFTGTKEVNIAPVTQNATYSIEVFANHENQLGQGGWLGFNVATGDYVGPFEGPRVEGQLKVRSFEKIDAVSFKAEVKRSETLGGDVRLIVENTWEGTLQNLTVIVEGFIPGIYDFD